MLLNAYAKVNLFLEVIARRDDGYHELVTILQTISLHDELELSLQPERINLDCNLPNLPTNERNLAYRAARLLKEKTGIKPGVLIHLKKNIPIGAGLGGGSSDAAAVLLGCNKLWNCKLSYSDLTELGMQLGMDVPFFLHGGTAFALGRGEQIVRQLPTPELDLVIIYPNIFVSTASVYKNLEIRLGSNKNEPTSLLTALESRNISQIAVSLYNRLESSTFKLHPQLAEIKDALISAGSLGALLSGSGSAIFGLAKTAHESTLISQKLISQTKFWVQSVKTIPEYKQ
jgi:4-diphosphocytidyl-2-C-methyl-D-erythritol kinase